MANVDVATHVKAPREKAAKQTSMDSTTMRSPTRFEVKTQVASAMLDLRITHDRACDDVVISHGCELSHCTYVCYSKWIQANNLELLRLYIREFRQSAQMWHVRLAQEDIVARKSSSVELRAAGRRVSHPAAWKASTVG